MLWVVEEHSAGFGISLPVVSLTLVSAFMIE